MTSTENFQSDNPYRLCPCCSKKKLIETGRKIVSRSGGKNRNSWRCAECFEKRQQGPYAK